jgi:RsiW-degrading membrane proteinase PrsW (M82 family)
VSRTARRALLLSPLVLSLAWLCYDAPGPFLREAYFVLVMLAATIATRTLTWGSAASALSLGIGVAAPLVVLMGFLLSKAGLDPSDSEFASWAIVPVLEELIKLVPVALVAFLHQRRTRFTFNPSDWLLVGCAAGAGFAMVENAELVRHDPGVLRDMAEQYGPSFLVPGAWGAAGYVGHATATGMIALGVGLAKSLKRQRLAISNVALVAPFAWVTVEHMLANLRVNTGSDAALLLGNGRLTPWLFVAFAGMVIALDVAAARRTLARSKTLRLRYALTRAALTGALPTKRTLTQRLLIALNELRLLNATAWLTVERTVTT